MEEEVKKLREKISDLKVILFLIENKHITTIANGKLHEKCHIDNKHITTIANKEKNAWKVFTCQIFSELVQAVTTSQPHKVTTSHQVQISYLRGHVPTSKLHLRRLNNNNNNNNGGNLSGTVTGTATSIASEGDLKMMTVYSF